jgi:hypothetical protein
MTTAIDRKSAAKDGATERPLHHFQPGNKIGPRFQKGHPFYPPKPPTRKQHQKSLQAIAKAKLRAIEEENGGKLTVQQRIHAENAARLAALAQQMFDSDKQVNLEMHDRLLKRQQRELELMNEELPI